MTALHARYGCGVEFALTLLAGKWKAVILAHLKQSPRRYGELRQLVPQISDKMLTQRLHDLEALGYVAKQEAADGHRYELTPDGERLRPLLEELHAWGVAEAARHDVRLG